MTNRQKSKKIEEIYERAKARVLELQHIQKNAVLSYIKELESNKIDALKQDITHSY